MSKCNKTEDDEEYGAKDEADTERATQRPLLASDAEFPPPPPPPNGSSLSCSNPDLVQVGTICRGDIFLSSDNHTLSEIHHTTINC